MAGVTGRRCWKSGRQPGSGPISCRRRTTEPAPPARSDPPAFDRAAAAAGVLTPIPLAAVGTAEIRRHRRAGLAQERAVRRSRWWFVLVLVVAFAAGGYVVLRTDQQLSAIVVWPTTGSTFVEIGRVRRRSRLTAAR